VKKKTQWADGGEEAQESLEIVVDDGNLAHDSDGASDEVRQHILILSRLLECASIGRSLMKCEEITLGTRAKSV